MKTTQLKLTFPTTSGATNALFLDQEDRIVYQFVIDGQQRQKIEEQTWHPGKKYPVCQPSPDNKPIALHRYLAGATTRRDCVRFRNENRSDCRAANLELVTNTYIARTSAKHCKKRGSTATPHISVFRDCNGNYFAAVCYRHTTIESPRYPDMKVAVHARNYMIWFLEPIMQDRIPEPKIPEKLLRELRPYLEESKYSVDKKPRPNSTPVPNMYLSAPWPNESYEYCFHHMGRPYRKAGYKSIPEALKAYNKRVIEITGDTSRCHRIPPELAVAEAERIQKLEKLGVFKNGKPTGRITGRRARELTEQLLAAAMDS